VKVGTDDVAASAELDPEQPPSADDGVQRSWAIRWAVRRKAAKTARDFAEADRIRALLKQAGWEVRDNRDGSIEVVRAGGP
jgi:cysteinyl-tRNA synthetase